MLYHDKSITASVHPFSPPPAANPLPDARLAMLEMAIGQCPDPDTCTMLLEELEGLAAQVGSKSSAMSTRRYRNLKARLILGGAGRETYRPARMMRHGKGGT